MLNYISSDLINITYSYIKSWYWCKIKMFMFLTWQRSRKFGSILFLFCFYSLMCTSHLSAIFLFIDKMKHTVFVLFHSRKLDHLIVNWLVLKEYWPVFQAGFGNFNTRICREIKLHKRFFSYASFSGSKEWSYKWTRLSRVGGSLWWSKSFYLLILKLKMMPLLLFRVYFRLWTV